MQQRGIHEGFPAAILKSGPEIKNHCSIWADSEENLASIPKSGPEIKNHCSIWADSEENLVLILKSEPEIKNHCSRGAILEGFPAAIPKLTPSNPESLHAGVCFLGKSRNDSQVWA